MPDLLLVHADELLPICFSPVLVRIFVGVVPSIFEAYGIFRYRLGVIGHHGKIDQEV